MSEAVALRGVDFLLRSKASRLLLNFFGGEPLLAWDLIVAAVRRAEAGRGTRALTVNLTTNGLLLDEPKLEFLRRHGGRVHLSLDGLAHANAARLTGTGAGAQAAMEAALRRLDASGVPYHVNAVADPARASHFDADLRALEDLGARRIQFGTRVAAEWSAGALRDLLAALDRWEPRARAELVNRFSDSEPVLLKNEILVDHDGALYWDGAVFLEDAFPRLRETLDLGHLDDRPDPDGLEPEPGKSLERLMAAYPPRTREGRLILNNIKVGLALQRRWPGRRLTEALG
jgi:hypothetical protein